MMGLVGVHWECFRKYCGHSISYRDLVLLAEVYSPTESRRLFMKLDADDAVRIQQ